MTEPMAKRRTPPSPTVRRSTKPIRSRSSRAWRRCASAPACTSGRPARTACTTWSTRSWTTRSTRRSPATATRSTSPSTPTTRSPSQDNGRGIPVDIHPTEKMPGVELALTVLHAGGKFDKNTYKVSGGLHGVGVSVVNALSERLEVVVERDGKRYHMAFVRGQDRQEARDVLGKARGTRHHRLVQARPRDLHRARVRLHDPRRPPARARVPEQGRHDHAQGRARGPAEGGDLLRQGRPDASSCSASTGTRSRCTRSRSTSARRKDDVEVELALQYNDGYNENTFSFVNNINTHEGGTHLTGFKAALTRTINDVAQAARLPEEGRLHPLRRRRPRGADLRAARQGAASRSSRGRPRPSSATPRSRASSRRWSTRSRQLPRGASAGRARTSSRRR